MGIFDKIGEGLDNIKERLVKEIPTSLGSSKKEPPPTTEERHAINLLLNEYDAIRELAHDFADVLRQTMGKTHSRQNILAAQEEFYAAVAEYVTVLTPEQVRRAHKQDPGGLFFLNLHEYALRDTRDTEQVGDLQGAFADGGDLKTRERSAGAAFEAQRTLLEGRGYEGAELTNALEVARHKIHHTHLGTEAALRHLAEIAPATERRFRNIADLPLASFIDGVEVILKQAHLKIHVEQVDLQNPIFKGIREYVHYALLEKVDRWRAEAVKTISQPFAYSIEHTGGVTRSEYMDEIDRTLHDPIGIDKKAKHEKEEVEKRVRTLQAYDLFLSELQRYASQGKEPSPTKTRVKKSHEREDEIVEVDNWIIGTVDADVLQPGMRRLVESIPQKDVQRFLLQKKGDLLDTLEVGYRSGETQDSAQFRFYELFFKIIEETGSSWRESSRGRDKLYFLQRDIQEEVEEKVIKARAPLKRFSDEIVAELAAEKAENEAFISTVYDLEDIVDHPETFKKLDTLGERLSLSTPDLVRRAAYASLIAAQKEYYVQQKSMPKRGDPEFTQSHYRMLREWYRTHPIARWRGSA